MRTVAGQRIAVVGATGFIGSHLTDLLVKRGAEVLGVARGVARLDWLRTFTGGCHIAAADIQDRDSTERVLREFRPEVVFHLASNTDGDESFPQMAEAIEVNITGTANLLESAYRSGAGVFVYADSCKVYGNGPTPYRQAQADAPICSYAAGKSAGWRLCLIASGFTDMQVCGLRPTFAYGPRQNPNLITYVQQCVRREHPVRLMGGSQTRDPIYVEDLARAFVAAAFTPAARNCALPVGGGCEISVADLSRSVVRLLDGDIDVIPEAEPPRRTEIWRSYCDNAEAGALLGWSPNVSLEEGLTRTLRAEPPEYHATAPLQTPFLGELR